MYGYNGGGGGGGGYQTTSYGAQGGADGGGFVNQGGFGSQGGSQDGPGGSKTYGKDTLRPVTIKQIIEAQQPHPDAEFKIDEHEITQITFVGQIHSTSTQTTNVTYKLDDGTGMIEVKQWIDSDAPEVSGRSALQDDSYVRVWGRLKAFNNKRHVGAHVIRPVTDMNEISMHLLEATYVHLYFTRGPPEALQPGANGGGEGGGGGIFVDQGGDGEAAPHANSNVDLRRMSPAAKKVFALLQNAPQNNEGLHVAMMAAQLGLPQNDVFKAGDELLGAGIIYTTVDDETWAVLD
ncbi:MAG: replication factor A protein 2 [Claussenomyces sp. TS43310]|nr:MAG: replication factor A protein 2 [Claussenomyces sp. TS43310]